MSTDGAVLEAVVGDLLRARGWWVAFAESCTGGLATSRMTDIPGSSDYVERSVVAYSNRAKIELLDVPEALIAEHGAVSEPVALAMAAGIRKRAGVNVGVGITGIAGPGGGSEQKPVGTVCIAVDGAGRRSGDRCARSDFPAAAKWSRRCRRTGRSTCCAGILLTVAMRVFVAVDVGDAVRREVTRVISALTGKLEAVKTPPKVVWVKPAALHVTIRFIGEVEPADVERLQELLAPPIRARAVRARVARHRHVPVDEAPARAVARRDRTARRRWRSSKPKCRGGWPASTPSSSTTRVPAAPHARPREDGRRRRRLAEDPAGRRGQARHVGRRSRDALSQPIVAAGAALYWIWSVLR